MKKLFFSLGLGLLVVAADQLTKQWALDTLAQHHTVSIFGDFLSLELTFNSGAAFSLGDNTTWVFTLLATLASVALPILIRRLTPATAIIVGVIWGGAVGNLIDRLFRDPGFPQGHVVDFINYNGWFIGNVADIALVIGVVALVIYEFISPSREADVGQQNKATLASAAPRKDVE